MQCFQLGAMQKKIRSCSGSIFARTPPSQTAYASSFEEKLNAPKSSQVLVDYIKESGKSAINEQELSVLTNDANDEVPSDVSVAASYLVRQAGLIRMRSATFARSCMSESSKLTISGVSATTYWPSRKASRR